ncbi:MAG: M14 family zinc carboxypeptidase [Firmicutes bacterium]|jgi:hypothetical protein|nr:M14 family zinc carboxypeptidase [Bacillota bacterium]
MTIDDRLKRVPEYTHFLTAAELYQHAFDLARERSSAVTCEIVGTSTEGQPIPMVRIGHGPARILVFACPHPNEPIGAMLAHFLIDEIAADDSLAEGRTWFILPCVDPDGTRLNEGWFRGPFSIRNYAKNFYRPKPQDQVEWTFPMRYKTFVWDSPKPETQALMRAIDIARPDVMYSLHNAGFGGAYYYVSEDLPGAHDILHRIPVERGIPLSLGEPEVPWVKELYPAVYQTSTTADSYDYYEMYAEGDPASYIVAGAGSTEYANTVCKPFSLVTEVPYFMSPKIGDVTPIERTRREVVLEGVQKAKEILETLDWLLKTTAGRVTEGTLFLEAVATFVGSGLRSLPSQEKWALEAEGMDAKATVAQEADSLYVGTFYRMLIASMLQRAFAAQIGVAPDSVVEEASAELVRRIDGWATDIEENLQYSVVPIRDLVQVQYGALLAVLEAKNL